MINLTDQIHAATKDGVIASAAEILDPNTGKKQTEINSETQQQLNDILSNQIRKEVIEELPEVAQAEENVIYIIPSEDTEENNVMDEYMLINGALELIGKIKNGVYSAGTNIEINANNVISANTTVH